MIPATIATLAMAALVYAFILSPIIRELRGGTLQWRPLAEDMDDDGDSASTDAPQTAVDADGVVGSHASNLARTAARMRAGAGTGAGAGAGAVAATSASVTATTPPSASASSSDA